MECEAQFYAEAKAFLMLHPCYVGGHVILDIVRESIGYVCTILKAVVHDGRRKERYMLPIHPDSPFALSPLLLLPLSLAWSGSRI